MSDYNPYKRGAESTSPPSSENGKERKVMSNIKDDIARARESYRKYISSHVWDIPKEIEAVKTKRSCKHDNEPVFCRECHLEEICAASAVASKDLAKAVRDAALEEAAQIAENEQRNNDYHSGEMRGGEYIASVIRERKGKS